jgi:hypothetical protein
METKYGFIVIIVEFGDKKIDFDNCKFNKIYGLFNFLADVQLLEDLTKKKNTN